jgi:hypothetical protein
MVLLTHPIVTQLLTLSVMERVVLMLGTLT